MVNVCVGDACVRHHIVDAHSGKEQGPVIEHPQTISTLTIAKNLASSKVMRRLRGASPLDPSFDGEVLQPEFRRITHWHCIGTPVKHERLSNSTCTKRRVAD